MTAHDRASKPDAHDAPSVARGVTAPTHAIGRQRVGVECCEGDQALTVVIPTKDRPKLLQRSVRSAMAQEDVEVTVLVHRVALT